MGSPLLPITADVVIQDLEECVLSSFNFDDFYYRFVDDIIMVRSFK